MKTSRRTSSEVISRFFLFLRGLELMLDFIDRGKVSIPSMDIASNKQKNAAYCAKTRRMPHVFQLFGSIYTVQSE